MEETKILQLINHIIYTPKKKKPPSSLKARKKLSALNSHKKEMHCSTKHTEPSFLSLLDVRESWDDPLEIHSPQETKIKNLFLIPNFLSQTESQKLIFASETRGYRQIMGDAKYRSNTRLCMHDCNVADHLWTRILELKMVPLRLEYQGKKWQAIGLNPDLRYCRYVEGQSFTKHLDEKHIIDKDIITGFTVNIYLNDVDTKHQGSTRFFLNEKEPNEVSYVIQPQAGLCLIFDHLREAYVHDGHELLHGEKYLLRTDILYQVCE